MTKQDIDQSYTSWLIYSDYLEENGQLNLAEQIRFELDYKSCGYFHQFNNYGDVGYSDPCDPYHVGGIYYIGNGNRVGGYSVGIDGVGGDASFAGFVGSEGFGRGAIGGL